MAEVIGVIGFIGQMFDGCMKAYTIFTTAANFGPDSQRLICKIRIEEMRLCVWGREWGVTEGRLEAHLAQESSAGNEGLRAIAVQTLTLIHSTICDVTKLKDRYGLSVEDEQAPSSPSLGGRTLSGKSSPKLPSESTSSLASRMKNELNLRARWVVADKDRFQLLLRDLKDFNDGLEKIFPPRRQETLSRAWTNELLQTAQQDLVQLKLLESAALGTYKQLNVSANLKQLRINLDTAPQSAFKPTFALKINRQHLQLSSSSRGRDIAGYTAPSSSDAQNVVVEWVYYDKEDFDERLNHIRRIDDLARMIHSASDRHPDLHTIDCLGYTDDTAASRYGLVYKAPESTFSSLQSLITSKDFRTPDLGDRFQLAYTLAVALWSLHSLDWLHKSVTSSNILFFPSAVAQAATQASSVAAMVPNIASPYLVGFDASRPEAVIEMSVARKFASAADIYRHPHSMPGLSKKPFCKSYDIYSLGLVLLEIGLWKVLQTYHKPNYTPEKFRDRVILPVLVPTLGSKTGKLYKGVVERCLSVNDGISSMEAGQLMEGIVRTLSSLNV